MWTVPKMAMASIHPRHGVRAMHEFAPRGRGSRIRSSLHLGQNGTWAVRCRGWMKLTDEQFAVQKRARRSLEWECTRWAIMKDYEPQPVRPEHVPLILERVNIAKDALLIPGDIVARNFRNGLLVDVSGTKTFPLGQRRFWSEKVYRRFYESFPWTIRDWMFLEDGSVASWYFDRRRLGIST